MPIGLAPYGIRYSVFNKPQVEDAYRKLSLGMLEKFEPADKALLDERIAKLWFLTPDCPGELKVPTRLIDRASTSDPTGKLYYWVLSTKGIAEYRAGRFPEAAVHLTRALEMTPATTPQCKVFSGLFLSMAMGRQGQRDQARQTFRQAAEIMDRHLQVQEGDLGAEWCDWLMCQIVRREAEEVLKSAESPATRS